MGENAVSEVVKNAAARFFFFFYTPMDFHKISLTAR